MLHYAPRKTDPSMFLHFKSISKLPFFNHVHHLCRKTSSKCSESCSRQPQPCPVLRALATTHSPGPCMPLTYCWSGGKILKVGFLLFFPEGMIVTNCLLFFFFFFFTFICNILFVNELLIYMI